MHVGGVVPEHNMQYIIISDMYTMVCIGVFRECLKIQFYFFSNLQAQLPIIHCELTTQNADYCYPKSRVVDDFYILYIHIYCIKYIEMTRHFPQETFFFDFFLLTFSVLNQCHNSSRNAYGTSSEIRLIGGISIGTYVSRLTTYSFYTQAAMVFKIHFKNT